MHKYKTFPTFFTAKKYPKLLPKLIAVHTHQSWKQKWHVRIVIPRMHCYVKPDIRFLGELVHTTTSYPTLKNAFKIFLPMLGSTFHNFSSHTYNWKIYIDIFYGVSCNIMHITAISNLYFQ